MSKKNLLNESQVRQFMKLASLEPLTPGFVEGLTETTEEAEELEELRTGRTGALAPPGGTANLGHGRGQGEAADGSLYEEEDLGAEEHDLEDAEHDMDHADDLEDDAAEDLGDIEAPADEGGGRMVSVDDFLGALESALEGVLGDEVEIDSDEVEPEEDEVEMDVELDAGDDVEDVEVEDELELQEGDEEEVTTEGTDDELEEGTKKGNIKKKDLKKKGHHGRGPKRRETAKEEDELAYEKNESTEATDDIVEQITKRVAARILKSALTKN